MPITSAIKTPIDRHRDPDVTQLPLVLARDQQILARLPQFGFAFFCCLLFLSHIGLQCRS
jgi:hypothetical protein